MLKVLLVDDEPFILQGLKLLVDWEKEGFRIAGTAANGMEALAFLKKEKVDLVIADIKMPQMTGLELLEHIRKEKISDAYFVILSGYAEFSFAQQAMQNDCTDYLLKPVDSEILCKVLNKVLALRNREELDHEKNRKLEQAYLARHMIALIQGKFDDLNVRYIHETCDAEPVCVMWRSRRKDPMMMRERQIEKCGHYRGGCMNTAGNF